MNQRISPPFRVYIDSGHCKCTATNIWHHIPIGRGNGLKIRTVWVRVPVVLPT